MDVYRAGIPVLRRLPNQLNQPNGAEMHPHMAYGPPNTTPPTATTRIASIPVSRVYVEKAYNAAKSAAEAKKLSGGFKLRKLADLTDEVELILKDPVMNPPERQFVESVFEYIIGLAKGLPTMPLHLKMIPEVLQIIIQIEVETEKQASQAAQAAQASQAAQAAQASQAAMIAQAEQIVRMADEKAATAAAVKPPTVAELFALIAEANAANAAKFNAISAEIGALKSTPKKAPKKTPKTPKMAKKPKK